MTKTRKPTHPGAVLREDVVNELGITITDFAKSLAMSRKTLSKILNERGSITPDMALRLSRALKTSPEVWLNMQKTYDLWIAEHESDAWKQVTPLPEVAA